MQELHTMYTNTLTAKTKYHLLVTNLLKEHIEAQRLHNTYATLCVERRRCYDQAKHDTMRRYADIKTSLLSYERFQRLRTDIDLLLAHHMQQAQYTWLQQERSMQLMHETGNSYQQKAALYWDASRQAGRTIYLIRKRPQEHRDPTLWEVPLHRLPKRQKAH